MTPPGLATQLPPATYRTAKGATVTTTLLDDDAFAIVLELAEQPRASQFVRDLAGRGFGGLSRDQMVWVHKLAMEVRRQ